MEDVAFQRAPVYRWQLYQLEHIEDEQPGGRDRNSSEPLFNSNIRSCSRKSATPKFSGSGPLQSRAPPRYIQSLLEGVHPDHGCDAKSGFLGVLHEARGFGPWPVTDEQTTGGMHRRMREAGRPKCAAWTSDARAANGRVVHRKSLPKPILPKKNVEGPGHSWKPGLFVDVSWNDG